MLFRSESGILASLTGGDVLKSALGGAFTSGVATNAADITKALGIDSQYFASQTGLTKSQIDNIVSGALSTSLVQSGLQNQDLANVLKTYLSSTALGSYAQNIVDSIGGKDFSSLSKLIGNMTNIATKAAVNNQDIGTAIQNNIPSIIGGLFSQQQIQDYSSKQIQQTELTNPSQNDLNTFNTLKQMFADAQNSGNAIDAGTQYALLEIGRAHV